MKKSKNKVKDNEYKKLIRNYRKSMRRFNEDNLLYNLEIIPKTKGLNRVKSIMNELCLNDDDYTNNRVMKLFKDESKDLDVEDFIHSNLALYLQNMDVMSINLAGDLDKYSVDSVTIALCMTTLQIMMFYKYELDTMCITGVYPGRDGEAIFDREKGGMFINPIFRVFTTVCSYSKRRYNELMLHTEKYLENNLADIGIDDIVGDENDEKIETVYASIVEFMDSMSIIETNKLLSKLTYELLTKCKLKKIYVKNLESTISEDDKDALEKILLLNNIIKFSIVSYNDLNFILIFDDDKNPIGIISLAGSKSNFNRFIIKNIKGKNENNPNLAEKIYVDLVPEPTL